MPLDLLQERYIFTARSIYAIMCGIGFMVSSVSIFIAKSQIDHSAIKELTKISIDHEKRITANEVQMIAMINDIADIKRDVRIILARSLDKHIADEQTVDLR